MSQHSKIDRLVVTGANGFVGSALVAAGWRSGMSVVPVVRVAGGAEGEVGVGDIGPSTHWRGILNAGDILVHTAALAHGRAETEAECFEVNTGGTRRLAEEAAAAGVKRLVFLSTIKVNGEQTTPGVPFLVSDPAAPEDAYGRSKYEAEQALWEVSTRTGLEVVVIRPPLVYGPGVKGNLLRLLGVVKRGLPLPLGSVDNRRSLIGLDNLVDLLMRCAEHPAAAGQTLLVSDGEDLSTPALLRHLAIFMGRESRLLPFPTPLLQLAGRALGRRGEVDRLIGSLQVDSHETCARLGWTPPMSVDHGLKQMVDWYLARESVVDSSTDP